MLPLGHAALAYLLYSGLVLSRTRRRPRYLACVPLAIGSQFPDLVDKPLAYVGVLSYGRSLAHSVFTFVLVSGVVWWGATTLRTRWPDTAWQGRLRDLTPVAFASGYLSHLLGDLYGPAIAGSADVRFVLYPIYAIPRAPGDDIAPWIRLVRIYREMGTHPQLELILLASVVFVGLHRWSE
ncbi:metal-dependent hydrolase [Natronomonas gomsonensis]|uniref:metal-dependent hydrolase n=1 Tax=Natronomonas gomsonensis TaxID=1046043 RepID=UPI00227D621F|nr:metal-dependent hydrolase [Natronomonas gomsonensis]MCY4732180.1 metal-dependent hydrolase [Natronomonas gomsonensis]